MFKTRREKKTYLLSALYIIKTRRHWQEQLLHFNPLYWQKPKLCYHNDEVKETNDMSRAKLPDQNYKMYHEQLVKE